MSDPTAPHRAIEPRDSRERLLISLLDTLWLRYRGRVEYARRYEELVAKHGGTFLNDHVAFRSFASQKPSTGIHSVSRIFAALGYRPAGGYEFPDKHLASVHFDHPNPRFPKLFVSELKVWELPREARVLIEESLSSHREPIGDATLGALAAGDAGALAEAVQWFGTLPWRLPERKAVEALNRHSQFGAWVLVNGYEVNHFTASVDAHGVAALSDIDKTVAAMRAAGIPMKAEIEGAPSSPLRQSSTEAVVVPTAVREAGKDATMDWTYAYFELAERPTIDGRRFEGFFGPQASNLFEMTKLPTSRSK